MSVNPETKLQREILDYLLLRGVFAWRNNAGFLRVGKRLIEMAPAGSPDIIGVLPGGKFIGVEVKCPGEEARPNQVQFHERLRSYGAAVAVVHSVTEARQFIDQHIPMGRIRQ